MRLYVGNLDYEVTSDELRSLFEPFGTVLTAEVQLKARTGQSRGFGLVDMPDDREAEAAIAALNGKEHRGRSLTVNQSRPRRTIRDLYASGWYGYGGR
jgi:RNA recognition motif-containing protein